MSRADSVKPIRYVTDARLAKSGDMVVCQQQWAEVIGHRVHTDAPDGAPVMGPAVEVITERGSRWFGWDYYHKPYALNSSREVASE